MPCEKTQLMQRKSIQNMLLLIRLSCFSSCQSGKTETAVQRSLVVNNISAMKIGSAISCTKGLTPGDSTVFMNNGGTAFITTIENKIPAHIKKVAGMSYIPGGEFSMGGINPVGLDGGGHDAMDDTRPIHRVYVDPFYMDETEVTNRQFSAFVKATGYITVAEQKPTKEEFPGVPEEALVAGAVVFTPPAHEVALNNHLQWWQYVHGASWRHPAVAAAISTEKKIIP